MPSPTQCCHAKQRKGTHPPMALTRPTPSPHRHLPSREQQYVCTMAPRGPWSHLTARMCMGWERCTFCHGDPCGGWDFVPEGGGWLRVCWPFWHRGTVSDCMLHAGYKLSKDVLMSLIRVSRSTSSSGHEKAKEEKKL